MTEHLPIFVYGTLKRGEVREQMWPHAPAEVREATLQAALFDLGPYPAITDGNNQVAGELWHVTAEHMDATLAALDEIECYGQGGVDLYVRRVVTCRDAAGEEHSAWTYFYADEEALASRSRVAPDENGKCRWSATKR